MAELKLPFRDRGQDLLSAIDDTRELVVEIEMRLRNQALDLAESLGCTPRSRARLGLDLQRQAAFDLAAHWQAEDESIEGDAEEEGEK